MKRTVHLARRNRRGSNQYATKHASLRFKTWMDISYLLSCIIIVSGIGYHIAHEKHGLALPIPKAEAQLMVTPFFDRFESHVDRPVNTPTPVEDEVDTSFTADNQQSYEAYIRTIFGSEADTAIAISHAECNPGNAKYPNCLLASNVEYSVGLFQINLYNRDQWVHAGRIPGATMEEKKQWIANPYNNILYAYWLYTTSGFYPWSTYLNGAYEQYLGN